VTTPRVQDQSRTPSTLLLFRSALQRFATELHTGLPGRVESYDPATQLADVQPLVMVLAPTEGGDLTAETLPILASVPVHFRAGGGMRETWPLAKGDTGWIKFSEASLDAWQANGGLVDPGDPRRFSIADAVFEPGLHANDKPFKHANATDYSVGNDDGAQVVVTPNGIELGGNSDDRPTNSVAIAEKVLAEFQKLQTHFAAIEAVLTGAPINEPGSGSPSALQAALAIAIAPANLYPAPSSVASANVKTK
jgi:hypothetical protein